jgi:hypothetical protein
MTPDLDTLLTALYVKIDDELKGIPRMGCPPRFTDAELVTVAVAQVLLGHESERGWIRAARKQIGHLFPYLPDQPGYNKAAPGGLAPGPTRDPDAGVRHRLLVRRPLAAPPPSHAGRHGPPPNAATWPAEPDTDTAPVTPGTSGVCACT